MISSYLIQMFWIWFNASASWWRLARQTTAEMRVHPQLSESSTISTDFISSMMVILDAGPGIQPGRSSVPISPIDTVIPTEHLMMSTKQLSTRKWLLFLSRRTMLFMLMYRIQERRRNQGSSGELDTARFVLRQRIEAQPLRNSKRIKYSAFM